MSTQQDIYAAGLENRPHMLNKENHVPRSSRLLRYAKSRPNGKLIHNSIINSPYVRRMIPEPSDPNHEVPVNETFHVQTDDELTEKELKQIEADDQAIQTILLGLPKDIYAVVDSCETAQEIWLRVPQMMKGSDIRIQEKKAKLFNEREMFTSTDEESIESQTKDLHTTDYTLLYDFLKYNQKENVGNQNGQIVIPGTNQNPNGNGNLIAARAEGNAPGHNGIQLQAKEFDLMAAAADLDEIKEVNADCILMANLQQASTSGTQTDKAPEEQYTELLKPILETHQVPQNDINVISEVTSVEQSGGTVEQHPANVEETRVLYDSLYHNLAIEVEKVNTPKFIGDFKSLAKEADESLAKYKALELEIERLLRAVSFGFFTVDLCTLSSDFDLGVDLLSRNRTTNLYTINLYEMASASRICLMARASSTKSWLWHQRLSHLNFDTINDLAKNDLVSGLLKFKYHKEYLCPSCEQGKIKRASHPPKPVPNSRQRLHLLHMDLCGPMRIASINGKRYVLVIVDDYSCYTWVHFLRSKDEAPDVIKTFLKRITILLQSPVIIIRTDNFTEFKNQVLKEYFDSVGISHQVSTVRTPQQNGAME
nr:retrovirus-related Pol polyprotein from transposon TNT 1-94 [Tanacetum cinerariifolium]